MTASIIVDKEDPLVDEVINITIKGLQKSQVVTVRAEVTEKGQVFAGSGCFVAEGNGRVDLSTQRSTGGTYKGVSAMGLFWSMKPCPGMPKGIRLIKSNASMPLLTHLCVFPGHLTFEQTYSLRKRKLCSKTIRRWYMAKDVQKIPVRSGRIRGSLFLPPGRGPFAGVIDMFGVAGSLIEFRAALLASRGFAALALPYFYYDDLPREFNKVEMEYFMEAVDWLADHPFIDGNKIGVIGVSKGGEIAFHLAYYNNKVKSIVCINAGPFFSTLPMMFRGEPCIGRAELIVDRIIETEEGAEVGEAIKVKESVPIWNKDVHVLLLSGMDDRCMKTEYMREVWERYPDNRKQWCKLYQYPNAGHLLEPPYAPFARSTVKVYRGIGILEGSTYLLWGGETVAHAHAQEDSWKQILNHFRITLQTPVNKHDGISSLSKL